MGEIVIRKPSLNKDFFRDHTFEDEWLRDRIITDIISGDLTSSRYPLACDFCSGNAYVASLLVGTGWQTENITCVDLYEPDKPFIKGVNWQYWDLMNLGKAIKYKGLLPAEVRKFKESFDIAMMVTGIDTYYSNILRYFLKIGGIACAYPMDDILRYDEKHWRQVKGTELFVERIS